MLFKKLTEDLPGETEWSIFPYRDVNPVSRRIKKRLIYDPNEAMRVVHKRLIAILRRISPLLPHATACRPGDRPRTTVLRHRRNRFFFLTDLTDAYGTVDGERLAGILHGLGFGRSNDSEISLEEIRKILEKFCLRKQGGLITGAPSSPVLFNIYAGMTLDEGWLGALVEQYSLTYTRYLDDLVFSSRHPIGEKKRRALRQAIKSAGFQVSHHKSSLYDLRKGPLVINGIGLERGGRIFLPRHYVRKVNGMMHRTDVSRAKVAGTMGVFFSSTYTLWANRTEERVLQTFREFLKTRPN